MARQPKPCLAYGMILWWVRPQTGYDSFAHSLDDIDGEEDDDDEHHRQRLLVVARLEDLNWTPRRHDDDSHASLSPEAPSPAPGNASLPSRGPHRPAARGLL
jgi:hypothetical protein